MAGTSKGVALPGFLSGPVTARPPVPAPAPPPPPAPVAAPRPVAAPQPVAQQQASPQPMPAQQQAPPPSSSGSGSMPSFSNTVNQYYTQAAAPPPPQLPDQNDGGIPVSMAPLAAMGGKPMTSPLPPTKFDLNPNLGKRILPESLNAIARLGRAAY